MVITVPCVVVRIGKRMLFMRLRLLRRVRYGLETKEATCFWIFWKYIGWLDHIIVHHKRVKSYDVFEICVSFCWASSNSFFPLDIFSMQRLIA